jgi:hypothetical protein
MLYGQLREMLEAEAHANQVSGLKRGEDLPVPMNSSERGEATVRAAKLLGVSSASIKDAKAVLDHAGAGGTWSCGRSGSTRRPLAAAT